MPREYTITAQQHVNRYDEPSGSIVRGWWVTYRDEQSKVVSQVFVPDADYPLGVNGAILQEIGAIRHVHNLTGE